MNISAPITAAGFIGLLPILQRLAELKGYTLAVVGAVHQELEIVAIPWQATAEVNDHFVKVVTESLLLKPEQITGPEIKPHHRRQWTIDLGHGASLKIHVMAIEAKP